MNRYLKEKQDKMETNSINTTTIHFHISNDLTKTGLTEQTTATKKEDLAKHGQFQFAN